VNDDVDLIRDSYGRYVTKVGSLIQIVLKVSTFKKRHHLVLIDECPSAMEPLPEEHTEDGDDTELGYGLQWYQHQSIRQNHLEIYSTILYPGEHIYTYYARTTNTGTFHVPSARVEEMYNRHYGMSSKDMLVVRGVNEDIYSIVAEDDISSTSRKTSSASKFTKKGTLSSPRKPLHSPRSVTKYPRKASVSPARESSSSPKQVEASPRSGSQVHDTLSNSLGDDVIQLDKLKSDSKKLKNTLTFEDDDANGFDNIAF